MTCRVIVVGGAGALGRGVLSHFQKASWQTINVDFQSNEDSHENYILDSKVKWTKHVLPTLDVDAVLHCAGGWSGGRLGDRTTLDSMETMWKMNLQSAILGNTNTCC